MEDFFAYIIEEALIEAAEEGILGSTEEMIEDARALEDAIPEDAVPDNSVNP